ncbi:pheromone A receptor-domain-containing protein [Cyathus striatus]|nr:pheromone A receptor-domain-containing protein [Cyathus striatus]
MAFPNYVFSLFAFIGFLMCAIPLTWQLEAWNAGTCLYMIWVGLACLNQFINSVIWKGDAIIRAVVWCDISSKFIIGVNVAIPASSLCIIRRLYLIASAKKLSPTKKEKLHAVYIDLAIGLGLPIIFMALHYIVQGHRFDVLGQWGCYPSTYFTPLAIVIVSAPPIIIGLVSMVYAVLTIIEFQKARAHLYEVLSHRNIPSTRYLRHMTLACVEILGTVPIATYVLAMNIRLVGVSPWLGWANTHYWFSHIGQIPAIVWRSDISFAKVIEASRWLNVICAFLFFAFFGFAPEARRNYRSAYNYCANFVGLPTLRNRRSSVDLSEARIKSNIRFLPVVITDVIDLKLDSSADSSPSTISSRIYSPIGEERTMTFPPRPEAALTRHNTVTFQFSPVRRPTIFTTPFPSK